MIKVSFIPVFTVILAVCITSNNTVTNLTDEQKQLLKQYAFCHCFDYAHGNPEYFLKEDISLSVYRDLAAGPPDELFNKLDSAAKKAASEIKPSIIADYDGGKAIIFGCFRFYNSKELESLLQSYQIK